MYTPPVNAVHDEDAIRAFVADAATAWLVTTGPDGTPEATALPIVWRGDTVVAHMARANGQWTHITGETPALLIVSGADAYVSPSWYAAKAEHGRVVPTWNYSAVHLTGVVRVRDDVDWLRDAVTELTDVHERDRDAPWHVTDAPEQFVTGQLRGIVGLEFTVQDVRAKAKLSQNRSADDQRGVVAGLRATGDADAARVADEMERA